MNKEELMKIELDEAVERFRKALQGMKDMYDRRDVRVEPKGSTLYVVYNRERTYRR